MQKTVSILVIAGSIAFLGAGVAQAAEYPAPTAPAQGVVSDSTIVSGETVIFSGSGFIVGETINITVIYNGTPPVGAGAGAGRVGAARTGVIVLNQKIDGFTTKADANGSFSVSITLPAVAGSYTLRAEGTQSGRVVESLVTVVASAAPGAGGTNTGGNVAGGTNTGSNVTGGTNTGGNVAGGTKTGVNVAGGATTGTTRGGLANTGIDSAMVLWGAAGIGALGLGAGSIVVARRRTGAEA